MRNRLWLLLPAVALPLGGCVAGVVAGAVGAATSGDSGRSGNKAFMQAAARQACSSHAAQYGVVQVDSVKHADGAEIVVMGTVAAANGKQQFECSFVTEITDFSLQPVQPAP